MCKPASDGHVALWLGRSLALPVRAPISCGLTLRCPRPAPLTYSLTHLLTHPMPDYFAHPAALVESEFVGERTRIWAYAHVLKGAVIGPDCNFCDGAFVEGGAVLGRGVTVKNGVSIWEGVTVEDGVFIGPNAAFTNDLRPRSPAAAPGAGPLRGPRLALPDPGPHRGLHRRKRHAGLRRHHWRMGAGGRGRGGHRDVPAFALVAGNPARQRGWVCAARSGCR